MVLVIVKGVAILFPTDLDIDICDKQSEEEGRIKG